MIKFFKKIILAVLAFLPFLSFAQFNYNRFGTTRYYGGYGGFGSGGGYGGGSLWNLFFIVMDFLSQAVIILIALAVVFFLYGILKYITAGEQPDNTPPNKKNNSGLVNPIALYGVWGY